MAKEKSRGAQREERSRAVKAALAEYLTPRGARKILGQDLKTLCGDGESFSMKEQVSFEL